MSVALEVGNLVGSMGLAALLSLAYAWLSRKIAARRGLSELESIGVELGLGMAELNNDEHYQAIRTAALSRCSGDLLRNRLSDVVGTFLTFTGVASLVGQAAIIVGAAWYCWQNETIYLAALWLMPLLILAHSLFVILVSFTCSILTGRMPGQAKATRRSFGLST